MFQGRCTLKINSGTKGGHLFRRKAPSNLWGQRGPTIGRKAPNNFMGTTGDQPQGESVQTTCIISSHTMYMNPLRRNNTKQTCETTPTEMSNINAASLLGPPRGQETGRNEMSHTVCDISLRPVSWPRGGPTNEAAFMLYPCQKQRLKKAKLNTIIWDHEGGTSGRKAPNNSMGTNGAPR